MPDECPSLLILGASTRAAAHSARRAGFRPICADMFTDEDLREVAEVQGAKAWMIDGPEDIRREWLEGVDAVGLTAGASAPEVLVQAVVSKLREWGAETVIEQPGEPETVSFPPPKSLRAAE